jgi:RHS repeat-associated protein
MLMPERSETFGSSGYRFAFNGKEQDSEGLGGGGSTYDYGFRIYNPALGKFLSVDPLFKSFPWYTPYQFAGNKPIAFIDLDGLEEYYYLYKKVKEEGSTYIKKIYSHTVYEKLDPSSNEKTKIEGEKWILTRHGQYPTVYEFDNEDEMLNHGSKPLDYLKANDLKEKVVDALLEGLNDGSNPLNPLTPKRSLKPSGSLGVVLDDLDHREYVKNMEYNVIVASFDNEENAKNFVEENIVIYSYMKIIPGSVSGHYRVSIGTFTFDQKAEALELRNVQGEDAWLLTLPTDPFIEAADAAASQSLREETTRVLSLQQDHLTPQTTTQ